MPRNGEAYNNALILNNLACVLLQSGAYRDAFSTFRDAVDTFRNCCHNEDDGDDDARRVLAQDNANVGKEQIAAALRKFGNTERRLHCNLDVSVVSFQDDAIKSLVFETAFGESMHVVFTLRPHSGQERDNDIDSAILLHNFALSHVYMSKCRLLPERKAHESALFIFRIAFRILFQKFETIFDSNGYLVEEEEESFENYCGAVTIVLANLVYTLNHEGFEREARDGFLQLREFLQNFSFSSDDSALFGRLTAAAAA